MVILEHPASFRDPSGYIFVKDGVVYRQINKCYRENYDHLMSSGLYNNLAKQNLIIAHFEVQRKTNDPSSVTYKIIKPEPLSFISYPYV